MKTKVLNMVKQTIVEVEEYVHIFKEYDHIWLDDKQEYLENVIQSGGNYFALEENDHLNGIQLRQFKDKSINLFNEQVHANLNFRKNFSSFDFRLRNGTICTTRSMKWSRIKYSTNGCA